MIFRTPIKPLENKGTIAHSDKILMLGSCFSDNIGCRFRDALMDVDINPMGTVYNSESMLRNIERLIEGKPITDEELFLSAGLWNHFGFHSRYSSADRAKALERMNEQLLRGSQTLARCGVMFVTLGTAMVYVNRADGCVVGNCHKLPASRFTRRMLSVDEVEGNLAHLVERVRGCNPAIKKIVFTVSPIRHVADGLEQNCLSKSVLRVAVGRVVESNPDVCDYFPSFEIMLDDLRDYRFYAADMVHPSEVAIDYIWNTLQATYFDDRAAQAVARCERVAKRLQHRVMSDNAEAAVKFSTETHNVLLNLVTEYPYLAFLPVIKKYL